MHDAGPLDASSGDRSGGPAEREPRSLLYTIFHASPTPISISRVDDGTLVDVNEEWAVFTGYMIEDSIGRPINDLGLWTSDGAYDDLLASVSKTGSVHDRELALRTCDGHRRTVVVSAQRISVEEEPCLLMVMNDITDYKRTVHALRESEERFHMLADSAPVLIWLADESRSYTYVNRPWLEFTGAPFEEHLGDGWATFVHPDERGDCLRTYEDRFEQRVPFSMEYRLKRHDTEYRWVINKAVPRHEPDGTFAGYIGSCLDINEQKETEQKLLEAKEHAEEMSKLKTSFLTNITHEIRTPLTVILGFTSILRQGVRSEYQRFVNLIERSGRRLLLMLDSMLDLAQLEAGTLEIDRQSHNVFEVVEGAVASVRPIAQEKGLDLVVQLPDERCYARFDHAVLSRVINNLLDNALKFTDQGHVAVRVQKQSSQIEIIVEDTGIGIDRRFAPQVFDPFVQESTGLDRTHQGSGLGLSVSKRLLERMGGTITLESEKGEGSVFTIILPAAD